MALTETERALLDEAKRSPYVRAALDAIAAAEGTASNPDEGYTTMFGNNRRFTSYESHPNDPATFTDRQGRTLKSTASGRYQITNPTYQGLAKKLGKTDFSPETQDEMAILLMIQKGAIQPILRGDIQQGIDKLGGTWAALPTSAYRASQGARSQQFFDTAYSNALTKYSDGVNVVYPSQRTQSVYASTLNEGRTPSPDLNPGTVRLTPPNLLPQQPATRGGGSNIRQALYNRYAQRPFAMSNNRLTPETVTDLSNALFNPNTNTPVAPVPYVHPSRATLIQPYPPVPVTEVVGVPAFNIPAVGTTGTVQASEIIPTGVSSELLPNVPIGATGVEVLPIPLSSELSSEIDTNFASLMNDYLTSPDDDETVVAVTSPQLAADNYIERELAKFRQNQNDSFLALSTFENPFRDELLEMIDNVAIDLG